MKQKFGQNVDIFLAIHFKGEFLSSVGIPGFLLMDMYFWGEAETVRGYPEIKQNWSLSRTETTCSVIDILLNPWLKLTFKWRDDWISVRLRVRSEFQMQCMFSRARFLFFGEVCFSEQLLVSFTGCLGQHLRSLPPPPFSHYLLSLLLPTVILVTLTNVD